MNLSSSVEIWRVASVWFEFKVGTATDYDEYFSKIAVQLSLILKIVNLYWFYYDEKRATDLGKLSNYFLDMKPLWDLSLWYIHDKCSEGRNKQELYLKKTSNPIRLSLTLDEFVQSLPYRYITTFCPSPYILPTSVSVLLPSVRGENYIRHSRQKVRRIHWELWLRALIVFKEVHQQGDLRSKGAPRFEPGTRGRVGDGGSGTA